jgi:hypothetical protein
MPTDHIVALLVAERDRINRAIEALQGTKRRGRPPKNPLAALAPAALAAAAPKKRSGGMSAAARKAQSERMKAQWAKRRKQAK